MIPSRNSDIGAKPPTLPLEGPPKPESSFAQKILRTFRQLYQSAFFWTQPEYPLRQKLRLKEKYADFSLDTCNKYEKDLAELHQKIESTRTLSLNDFRLLLRCHQAAKEAPKESIPESMQKILNKELVSHEISSQQIQQLLLDIGCFQLGKKQAEPVYEFIAQACNLQKLPPLSISALSSLSFSQEEWNAVTAFLQGKEKAALSFDFFSRQRDLQPLQQKLSDLQKLQKIDYFFVDDQRIQKPTAQDFDLNLENLMRHLEFLDELNKRDFFANPMEKYKNLGLAQTAKLHSIIHFFNLNSLRDNQDFLSSWVTLASRIHEETPSWTLSIQDAEEIDKRKNRVPLTTEQISIHNFDIFLSQLELYKILCKTATPSTDRIIDQLRQRAPPDERFTELIRFYDKFKKNQITKEKEEYVNFLNKNRLILDPLFREFVKNGREKDVCKWTAQDMKHYLFLRRVLSCLQTMGQEKKKNLAETIKHFYQLDFEKEGIAGIKQESGSLFISVLSSYSEMEINPFPSILEKIENFNKEIFKRKLTVKEYYLVKYMELDMLPLSADDKRLIQNFRTKHLALSSGESENIVVNFQNLEKMLASDPEGKRRTCVILQLFFKTFFKFPHVNFTYVHDQNISSKKISAIGMGEMSAYTRNISPFADPQFDYYRIDEERLGNRLGLKKEELLPFQKAMAEELRSIFNEASHSGELLSETQSKNNLFLRYWKSKIHLRRFKIKEFYLENSRVSKTDTKAIIQNKRELVCVDFVVHAMIEATAKAYEKTVAEDDPRLKPDILKALGFSSRQAPATFTPILAHNAMTKAGILKPHQPVERFVSFQADQG